VCDGKILFRPSGLENVTRSREAKVEMMNAKLACVEIFFTHERKALRESSELSISLGQKRHRKLFSTYKAEEKSKREKK
jgi:hypothetical protein